MGRLMPSRGIQLCIQISVVSPSPMRLMTPCARMSRPSNIARQIWDGCGPSSAWRSEQCGKYTALRIRALSEVLSVRVRHACLARSARLKIYMSRNPRPPKCFGRVIISHATQLGFLLPCLEPHQNCRISDIMLSHKPRGSLKQYIE